MTDYYLLPAMVGLVHAVGPVAVEVVAARAAYSMSVLVEVAGAEVAYAWQVQTHVECAQSLPVRFEQ